MVLFSSRTIVWDRIQARKKPQVMNNKSLAALPHSPRAVYLLQSPLQGVGPVDRPSKLGPIPSDGQQEPRCAAAFALDDTRSPLRGGRDSEPRSLLDTRHLPSLIIVIFSIHYCYCIYYSCFFFVVSFLIFLCLNYIIVYFLFYV